MSLGFSVETLVPAARGGGGLRMGLTRMDEADWRDPAPDLAVRAAAFDAAPESVIVLPGAEAACREAAKVAAGDISSLRGAQRRGNPEYSIEPLDGFAPLARTEDGKEALEAAARAGWEDLCILQPGADGMPVLTAAAVAFPTDWRLADKIGLPVAAIHAPIHGYAEQLSAGVDHFLGALRPGAIFGRTNWFVTADAAWRYLPEVDPAQRFAHVTAGNVGETLFVRCERQTLRRLPETGAILFAIGVYVARLDHLPAAIVCHVAQSVAQVPQGEGARRAAPYYAEALAGYAAGLDENLEKAA